MLKLVVLRFMQGVLLEDGESIDSILPCHAGRGVFTLRPMHGKKYTVRFEFKEHRFDFDLPKAEQEGVRLWVEQDEEGVYFDVAQHFDKPRKLMLNVYCRGKKSGEWKLKSEENGVVAAYIEDISEGVNQVVVTDSLGNVYADRLFFVNKL